jgi:hypothetical protein
VEIKGEHARFAKESVRPAIRSNPALSIRRNKPSPGAIGIGSATIFRRKGITRDLEAMARVGIGEAFVGNIFLEDVPAGKVKVLTEEWWDMVEHAIREGGRVGVNIGMFNCPGWSQSGGPWIEPEQAMRHLAFVETRVPGSHRFEGKLPRPVKISRTWRCWLFRRRKPMPTRWRRAPRVTCTPARG